MDSDSSIANSGYGQDKMLVNPIHMAMIYSSFANGGNMVMPVIEKKENNNLSGNIVNSSNSNITNTIKYSKQIDLRSKLGVFKGTVVRIVKGRI